MNTCSVCGKAPVVGWGFCKKHYRAFDKYGDPLARANLRGVPLEDRVRVDEDTGCLLWVGSRTTSGYGIIHEDGEHAAHRLAYRRYVGPIPDGMHVLHTCDRPECVWPEHLFLGTHIDNMADMKDKGRAYAGKGSLNKSAKLDETQAIAIMQDIRPTREIAEEFGISTAMVGVIQNGKAWKHAFKEEYRTKRLEQSRRKLTPEEIEVIRVSKLPQMQLAAAFGTSQSTVSLIKRGKYRLSP